MSEERPQYQKNDVNSAYIDSDTEAALTKPPADRMARMTNAFLELRDEATGDGTQTRILEVCLDVAKMLVAKNKAYGNSALDPVRIFSSASTIEQILVRIDDKLSRLSRGLSAGEDVEHDLMGYLVLLRVARDAEKDRGE